MKKKKLREIGGRDAVQLCLFLLRRIKAHWTCYRSERASIVVVFVLFTLAVRQIARFVHRVIIFFSLCIFVPKVYLCIVIRRYRVRMEEADGGRGAMLFCLCM